MSQLKNLIKDLFDLRKPIVTVKKKLTLVGIIFLLDVLFNILIGTIKKVEFCYSLIFSESFIGDITIIPAIEGFIHWWPLWFLALMILWSNPDLKLTKLIIKKVNLAWFLIALCGASFYLAHLVNRYLNYSNSTLIEIGVVGIIYGWLVIKTRSLWPNILCHALWNFCTIVFFC